MKEKFIVAVTVSGGKEINEYIVPVINIKVVCKECFSFYIFSDTRTMSQELVGHKCTEEKIS